MSDHHVPINSPAPVNRARPRRLVTVYFHTNRYRGTCKLIPTQPSPGQPSQYESDQIVQGVDDNIWGATFPDEDIPAGEYILETPCEDHGHTHKVRQRIRLDHAYQNVIEVADGKVTEKDTHEQILHEPLIGDGYSLEEACLRMFAYKYSDNMALLLKLATPAGEKAEADEDKKKKSAFATAIGVTEALHDRIEASLGVISLENKYFKNFAKIWALGKRRPKSCQHLKNKVVAFFGERGEKVLDQQVRRWGLNHWQEHLEHNQPYKKFSTGVEVLGQALEVYQTTEELAGFIEAFNSVHEADLTVLEGFGEKYREGILDERFEPWFSRGDMSILESLCQEADNRAGEAQVEGAGFTGAMLGGAMGLFFEEGFIASILGKKFGKALDVLGWVKGALVKFDDCAFQAQISNFCRDIKEWWHDIGAAAHNNSTIFYIRVGRTLSGWDQAEYALALLYRAKVLYGLMDLIDRCGKRTEHDHFNQKVKELRIQQYIDNFIFRPCFWVRNDHVGFDWVERFHLEKDAKTREEVVRFDSPSKDGSTVSGWKQWGPDGWTKVEFHRWFPIHFMDHPNAAEFAADFSTNYHGISRKDVATTFWQVAAAVEKTQAKAQDGERDVDLEVTSWRTLQDNDIIDSEMPVRAVLLLKTDKKIGTGTPVTFQLCRVDWLNVDGPVCKTVIRRLGPHDKLPESVEDAKSKQVVGGLNERLGAIAMFNYSYTWTNHGPSKLYWGLKPLKGVCHDTWPQGMRMSVRWRIGHNEAHDWLANGQEINLIPFNSPRSGGNHVGLYDKQFDLRNHDKFRDKSFLERETATEEFKADVPKSDVKAVIQANFGGEWKSLDPGSKSTVLAYGQDVRVVLRVVRKAHYDDGVPAAVRLVRTDGDNAMGPIYRSEKMFALAPFGFKGEWGTVIPLYWYLLSPPSDAQRVEGIKPIHRGSITEFSRVSFASFTFDLRYRVGDSWGSNIWHGFSEWETAKPDDVRFDMSGQEAQFGGLNIRFLYDQDGASKKAILLNASLDKWRVLLDQWKKRLRDMAADGAINADLLTEIQSEQ